MTVQLAEFICSNTKITKLPLPNKPEYALIGRSNVGKSSLINMLTNKKQLAKVSKDPGKTQVINHFLINKTWYLVDLPGYGYAYASKIKKEHWGKFVRTYLDKRTNLQCVFVLIDSRLQAQKIDLDFCNWLGQKGLFFSLVFTKIDKQSKDKIEQHISWFNEELMKNFETTPTHFVTSSVTHQGRQVVLDFIEGINIQFVGK